MGHQYSVLVVDDDPSWRRLYKELFEEEEGYLVETASNKEEAADQLAQSVFDVAIIDLRLVDSEPKNTDGVTVVQLIRDRNAPTRAIVKSGHLTPEVRKQLEQMHVFAILDKEASSIPQLTSLVAQAAQAG